jgi:phosphate transport system protein
MSRDYFDRELGKLDEKILRLGNAVEENLLLAVTALRKRDLATSHRLIEFDDWVNDQRIEIMMGCFTLIATQQPTGPDMRSLAATISIAGELERIHDYVKGISKISLTLGADPLLEPIIEPLDRMTFITTEMLRQSIAAFSANDPEMARAVPRQDDEVDALYEHISHTLSITVTEELASYERANLAQWAVHNLERSADRVINICEWVVYKATGKYVELDSEYEAPPALSAA